MLTYPRRTLAVPTRIDVDVVSVVQDVGGKSGRRVNRVQLAQQRRSVPGQSTGMITPVGSPHRTPRRATDELPAIVADLSQSQAQPRVRPGVSELRRGLPRQGAVGPYKGGLPQLAHLCCDAITKVWRGGSTLYSRPRSMAPSATLSAR